MTASTLTQPAARRAGLSPLMALIVALAAFTAGIGTASVVPGLVARGASGQQPAPAFNAVQFRAQEHAAFQPASTFDAVLFRAEERQP